MTGLRSPYTGIQDGQKIYYGGNQQLSDRDIIKKCGCGIVAAADVSIYMQRRGHCAKSVPSPLPLSRYNSFLRFLNNRYFPLIPGAGLNAFALAAGMNLYFRHKSMHCRARWCFSGGRLYSRIEAQLSADIPVILSVGPNFPFLWQKNRLNLYLRSGENFSKYCSTKAHFVTVTGIDEKMLRISSWGRELYIERDEFTEYTKSHSCSFLCNMLQISE